MTKLKILFIKFINIKINKKTNSNQNTQKSQIKNTFL